MDPLVHLTCDGRPRDRVAFLEVPIPIFLPTRQQARVELDASLALRRPFQDATMFPCVSAIETPVPTIAMTRLS